MENEKAKLFVGGISRETTEEDLKLHFQKYGAVLSSLVAKDKTTGTHRGFGFVQFSDPSAADLALCGSHSISGRTVEVKKAVPRSEQHQCQQQQQQQLGNSYQHRNNGFGNPAGDGNGNDFARNTKKIFVGGLPSSLTKEQFKNFFERFGRVVDVVVMQDSLTNRPRGFGFITFESKDSVDRVLVEKNYELNGRSVEVKRAVPKDEINAKAMGYTPRAGARKPSDVSAVSGTHVSYGTGYHFPSSYVTYPGYIGIPSYVCGTDAYERSYPMLGYGRTGYGVPTVLPRSPWNGNMMIGPAVCATPYTNGSVYHAYMSNGVSMPGLYNRAIVPTSNGYMNHVYGGNGHLLSSGAPPSGEGGLNH